MVDKKLFFSDAGKNEIIKRLLVYIEEAKSVSKIKTKIWDDDIQIYIAYLLFGYAMPNYTYIIKSYIKNTLTDVELLISMAEDDYFKYFIYKVNADNLLLHLGLFDNLMVMNSLEERTIYKEYTFKNLKYYYNQAATVNKKIHRKKTALSDVLYKIAKNGADYTKILKHTKTDYFNFYCNCENIDFMEFRLKMYEYEQKYLTNIKEDEFLENYFKYLNKPSITLKNKINTICKELHSLDSNFNFKL